MDTIIGTATTTFLATTGFSLDSVVDFMTDQITLVIGSGLGLLQALIPWIVALALIGGAVYFLYRSFSFFRH